MTTTELPSNLAARLDAERRQREKSVEGQRAFHAAAEAARLAKAAERRPWHDFRRLIAQEVERATTERHLAIECHHLEAALAADQRVTALRALLPAVDDRFRHKFGQPMNMALAGRV